MIKGKSVEEIRKHFNIVNDFTPEEEEQIRKVWNSFDDRKTNGARTVEINEIVLKFQSKLDLLICLNSTVEVVLKCDNTH